MDRKPTLRQLEIIQHVADYPRGCPWAILEDELKVSAAEVTLMCFSHLGGWLRLANDIGEPVESVHEGEVIVHVTDRGKVWKDLYQEILRHTA